MIKKWFTLVELIVVITILAILWTIGFISLQWYSRDARNSVRIADINNMKKGLELYMLKTNKYAPPTTPPLNEVTYSWELVWRQWVFWDTVVSKLWNISKPPLDPLTQTPYAYSVLNTELEYEIGWIMEWNVAKLWTETNAAWTVSAISFVKWNYNGQVAKVQKWNTTIVLAVPTIINSDIWEDNLETIVENQSLAYNWTTKVAWAYSWTTIRIEWNWEEIVKEENLVVFSWDISTIDPTAVVDNLQKAYSGTSIADNGEIAKLLNTTDKSSLWSVIINNNLGWDISVSNVWSNWWWNSWGEANLTGWRAIDPNCEIEDIVIWNQIWAGCNSTIWDWLEYWEWVWATSEYCSKWHDWNHWNDCIIGSLEMLSNSRDDQWYTWIKANWDKAVWNIWWKFYTDNNAASACKNWYSLPNDTDFINLELELWCSTSDIVKTNVWRCYWLGWNWYESKDINSNLVKSLKLPLSWYKINNTLRYVYRWWYWYLRWIDSVRRFKSDSIYSAKFSTSNNGYWVRCIKD